MRFASIKIQLLNVDLSTLGADDELRLARGDFCDKAFEKMPSSIGGRVVMHTTRPERNSGTWGPNVASREAFIGLAADAAAKVWDTALRRGFIDEKGQDVDVEAQTTPAGMTIAGDGASELGKLMREQHAAKTPTPNS